MEHDVKQVIIIRKDLHMRRGKEVAQGAHASIAWLTGRVTAGRWKKLPGHDDVVSIFALSPAEWAWTEGNFRKICVVVNSEEELLDVYHRAKYPGLTAELIEDTGLTEFHGQKTFTAAAVGPDYDERIDPVTGHLTLY
jgi:PTH2 family peptidyl-tRNA hydrolase